MQITVTRKEAIATGVLFKLIMKSLESHCKTSDESKETIMKFINDVEDEEVTSFELAKRYGHEISGPSVYYIEQSTGNIVIDIAEDYVAEVLDVISDNYDTVYGLCVTMYGLYRTIAGLFTQTAKRVASIYDKHARIVADTYGQSSVRKTKK